MKYKFVQDNEEQWYLIPVSLYEEFMIHQIFGESKTDFEQYKQTFHLSQYSFECPVIDEWFTPMN